jgi:hypothetical protein
MMIRFPFVFSLVLIAFDLGCIVGAWYAARNR